MYRTAPSTAPFAPRATRETADCLANHIAKEYAAYHRIEIELVHEMFCVVIFGLVGLVKMNPRIEDDVLMKVTEQTLRLDMAPLEAGEGGVALLLESAEPWVTSTLGMWQ